MMATEPLASAAARLSRLPTGAAARKQPLTLQQRSLLLAPSFATFLRGLANSYDATDKRGPFVNFPTGWRPGFVFRPKLINETHRFRKETLWENLDCKNALVLGNFTLRTNCISFEPNRSGYKVFVKEYQDAAGTMHILNHLGDYLRLLQNDTIAFEDHELLSGYIEQRMYELQQVNRHIQYALINHNKDVQYLHFKFEEKSYSIPALANKLYESKYVVLDMQNETAVAPAQAAAAARALAKSETRGNLFHTATVTTRTRWQIVLDAASPTSAPSKEALLTCTRFLDSVVHVLMQAGIAAAFHSTEYAILGAWAGAQGQVLHSDFDHKKLADLPAHEKPLSCIVAVEKNTTLDIQVPCSKYVSGERKTIAVPTGSVAVFLGDTQHAGSAYKTNNVRFHIYLKNPRYPEHLATNITYLDQCSPPPT